MEVGYRPKNLEEALYMRKTYGARPLAGGTDLMVRYRDRAGALPDFPWPILFINHLDELRGCSSRDGSFLIRAATSYSEILRSSAPDLLKEAIREIAAPALRNLGTLAGNVCNASPAGDAVCALYALDATIEIRSLGSIRTVPIEEVILGPGKIDLHTDELVTAIIIPEGRGPSRHHELFRKVGTRKANALSKVVFSGRTLLSQDTAVIQKVALAVGAVAPTIVRSQSIEQRLAGSTLPLDRSLVDQIVASYEPLIRPIDDQRSTAEYRRHVALNLIREYLLSLEELLDERT